MLKIELPDDLRARLELLRIDKGWPETMTPERIAALAMTRMLYELGAIETSHEAYTLADCPRMAWLSLGLPIKDQLAQLSDETDLWLGSLGEEREPGEES